MTLFRLDSSIRQQGSVSRQVADTLEKAWSGRHPDGTVIRRDLTAEPLPPTAWTSAAGGVYDPQGPRSPQAAAAGALSAALVDELLASDVVVVATSLYNFGVSQHLKNWIDLVLLDPRAQAGNNLLDDRPVTLVVARGGGYGAGTPREGWDHATPYLVRIFSDVMGADVTVVEAELTLADVVPAMAELRPLAAESLAQAHERAAERGRALADLVGAGV
ncbi:NAD(P)H-dependent oxidoreductase [Actinomycetes bacterium KLBMP 9759]